MKAAFYTGDKTFEIRSVEAQAPAADEVQVQVAYCGVCGTDLHAYHGSMDARIGHNRVIGHEMSGTVTAIGSDVGDVKEGDHVVIRPLKACGECPACKAGHSHICHNLKFLGLDTDGAFQQSWTVPANTVHKIPSSMPLKYGALVEPIAVACHDVRRSRLQAGEDVLVIGGGPIGMLVAMVARKQGGNVIISEVSEQRLAFAQQLGFETINPLNEDLVTTINQKTWDKGADVVFEVSGSQPGVEAMTAAAAVRGRIVMVAIHPNKPQVDMFQFFWRELELLGARVYEGQDFEDAIQMVTNGDIDCESMITDVRALSEITQAFEALSGNPQAMKSLIQVADEIQ
ncbi:alcohol dehydrogenase catalytic domain-containing protein [Terasakiella sp. SH-1]|uniref:zinc-dependent alcohol dehydrogenase n=1 Tax=Terasakiella sp. SH-1 TaxID=2560057 RepID=UPI001072F75D|nr:alcohol dehydrogenase catalytic domain-containing protein [Terasakiella sp. SH-1]